MTSRDGHAQLRVRILGGLAFTLTVAIALTITGCHVTKPGETTPPVNAAKALQELQALPSFEDTKAQVLGVMHEITTAARQLMPSTSWETLDQGMAETCHRPPYEQADARGFFLPDEVATNVNLSEQNWPKIQEAAKTAAAKLDATEIQVMKDKPGDHDVGFYGPGGLFIKVGYGGNLVVSGYTGCRLPQEKK